MKKIRIELKPESKMKSYRIFDSAESLYVWLKDVGAPKDIPESFYVDLLPGDYIEVEWMGCEYVHEYGITQRLDSVRLAKASQTKNASGMLVEIYFGWIANDTFIFRDHEDEDSYTIKLITPESYKLDLDLLFGSNQDDENSEEENKEKHK